MVTAVRGLGLTWVLAIVLLSLPGCRTLFVRPVAAPAPLAMGSELRIDPATRQQAFAELFPPLERLQTGSGSLSARSRWWPAGQAMRFILLADEPDLRFSTRNPLNLEPIFDVVIREGMMTVVLHRSEIFKFEGGIFHGPIEGASPFGRILGVEPVDMVPIFLIGQLVAQGNFESGGWWRPTLEPVDPSAMGGLRQIVLDRATGLPARAWWARGPSRWRFWAGGRSRWNVQYHVYDFFLDPRRPELGERLMPREFVIRSSTPAVTMRVSLPNEPERVGEVGYRFNQPVTAQAFQVREEYPVYPLEELERVLRAML